MTNNINLDNSKSKERWIYICRQHSNKRKLVNYSEVHKILKKYSVKPVYLENISLIDELKLVNNTDGIIAPHGAGLTAIAWGRDIKILEIFNNVVKAPYYVLADILDHNYTALSAGQVQGGQCPRNKNIILDTEILEKYLKKNVR